MICHCENAPNASKYLDSMHPQTQAFEVAMNIIVKQPVGIPVSSEQMFVSKTNLMKPLQYWVCSFDKQTAFLK